VQGSFPNRETLRLDLSGLTVADATGVRLLTELIRQGAELVACSGYVAPSCTWRSHDRAFDIETDFLSRLRAGDEEAFAVLVRENTGKMLPSHVTFSTSRRTATQCRMPSSRHSGRSITSGQLEPGDLAASDHDQHQPDESCVIGRAARRASIDNYSSAVRRDRSSPSGDPALVRAGRRSGVGPRRRRSWCEPASSACQDGFRTVLVLRDIEGIDTEQTATLLGVNCGAVKTRLHRARLRCEHCWSRTCSAAPGSDRFRSPEISATPL